MHRAYGDGVPALGWRASHDRERTARQRLRHTSLNRACGYGLVQAALEGTAVSPSGRLAWKPQVVLVPAPRVAYTTAWFAIQLDDATFGIFDVFPGSAGRQAHLDGPIAAALLSRADELLSSPPEIKPIDVLAGKLPG